MVKAVLAAIGVYLLADAGGSRLLEFLGLEYLHAFVAMFLGMTVGGYLSQRNFVGIAVLINLVFSMLSYILVSRMRDQPVLDLIAEQHLMVSVGSFAGAVLGAWFGMNIRRVAERRKSIV